MDVSGSWHRMYSVCVNVYGKSWVFILISARHDPSDARSLLGYLFMHERILFSYLRQKNKSCCDGGTLVKYHI